MTAISRQREDNVTAMLEPVDGIDREAIESTSLSSLGYSPERQVFSVEFKSGLILHYSGISPELAAEFYCAESYGRFYAARIRGKFPAVTMTGPCGACGVTGVVGTSCSACGESQHYRLERRPEPTGV